MLSTKFPLKQHIPILKLMVPNDSKDLDNGLTTYAPSF